MPAVAGAASASWASQGACLDSDPDLFVPIAPSGPGAAADSTGKSCLCADCPVRIECLSYALEFGGVKLSDSLHAAAEQRPACLRQQQLAACRSTSRAARAPSPAASACRAA